MPETPPPQTREGRIVSRVISPDTLEGGAMRRLFGLYPQSVTAAFLAEQEAQRTALHGDTGGQVRSVLERLNDKPLSFTDAARALKEGADFDLQAAREEHVRDKLRWGHIGVKEVDTYGASFDTAQLSEQDIARAISLLKAGTPLEAVFDGKTQTLPEAFQALKDGGIRTYGSVDAFSPNGDTEGGYDVADTTSVILLPHSLAVPEDMTEQTADARLQNARTEGSTYLEPTEWINWFLKQVDRGLQAIHADTILDDMNPEDYRRLRSDTLVDNLAIDAHLPDISTWTQCPRWRISSGGVLRLCWDPGRGYRGVGAHGWDPGSASGHLGPRSVLGRFLA